MFDCNQKARNQAQPLVALNDFSDALIVNTMFCTCSYTLTYLKTSAIPLPDFIQIYHFNTSQKNQTYASVLLPGILTVAVKM